METNEERAWAAGFYDGEGHTQKFKRHCQKGERRYVHMCVTQREVGILKRFREAVGGVGYLYGPFHFKDNRGYKRNPIYYWKATNRQDVATALEAMWPWLGETKRAQAQAALDAQTSVEKIMGPQCERRDKRRREREATRSVQLKVL